MILGILERSNALRFDKLFDLFFEIERETDSIRFNDERIRIPVDDNLLDSSRYIGGIFIFPYFDWILTVITLPFLNEGTKLLLRENDTRQKKHGINELTINSVGDHLGVKEYD